ncbi:DUF1549 and DUF1553 domain-containing protein [Allorhodopirellula heiligendammensis]|uniref:BIG2 domain-containing protein n=1 Tax=Allorhodopirellula heiligendammensis TaxID=2714739 RepID=A0A5C6BGZ4_9BACT|nr:DUF1549 and DUF1553 domain-containing protein [Allorhodopirellula heiligendammensis]TWU10771.1 hypothetical protein Poly21_46770 [Allorhodopirellula heiligendammensis]
MKSAQRSVPWIVFPIMLAIGVSFCLPLEAEPVWVHSTTAPSDVMEPLPQRFAEAGTSEVPDFQKHVMPLLGRLGCNGRACHGSFQGQGGFQLSLFGYDFQADHAALLAESAGRVDPDDVDESLILAKPTDADMHEGGKRFEKASWQYRVLSRWIEAGAESANSNLQVLDHLEVLPTEVHFDNAEQDMQLTAIAHWADGTREDVTALCRFSTNDDAVAAIDENGHVRSGLQGDTHVVVAYDRAVVPVSVIRPVQVESSIATPPLSDHAVDRLVAAKHSKLGIVPSPLCTDAEFIRRVSLDMTGTLPAAEEVRRFLADDDTDKRQRLIEELLEAPGYAAWWATRLSDWTGNSEEQLNNVLPVRGAASRLWYEWLRVRLDDNIPYDEIVAGIVTAESRQDGESYLEYCQSLTAACQPGNEGQYAARDGMPLFWARRNLQQPEERAIGFAYAFMGIRIECAQCHKHPFDQWSKDDFDQFAKLFSNLNARPNTVAKDAVKTRKELLEELTGGKDINNGDLRKLIYKRASDGDVVPFPELVYNQPRNQTRRVAGAQKRKNKNQRVPVAAIEQGFALGESSGIRIDQDPRDALMQWLRAPENPYFARAIVNRVWANYFGIGLINPTDDMNLANPASNEPLLDYLAAGLREHEYDLHWLHREITTSDAYQRSTQTNASNTQDRTNFSRHVPRRLPAEVIRDAVLLATQSTAETTKMRAQMTDMAIAADIPQRRNQRDFALQVFGQSQRESNCDCDRSDSPSLLQSIYLRNDIQMYQQLASKDGWVAQACESLGEAGPHERTNPAADQITRKADLIRRQTIARIERFQSLDASKRARQREKTLAAYRMVRKRFAEYGFATPTFADLLADPTAWQLTRIGMETPSSVQKHGNDTLALVVDEAYLRTLSRLPDTEEAEIAKTYIEESETVAEGLSSIVWALVNTKEFIITH